MYPYCQSIGAKEIDAPEFISWERHKCHHFGIEVSMSLTSLIDDKNSELSEWMEWTFDRRAITRLVSEINNLLDQQPLLLIEHNQCGLVGTAFDYLWLFGISRGKPKM